MGKNQRGIFERPPGSGVWWVLYYDELGLRHREKVGMKSAALRVYQQRKTEIRQGKFEPDDVQGKNRRAVLMEEIISDKMEASKLLKGYKADVPRLKFWKRYFEGHPGRSVTASDIEKARLELSKSKSKSNNNQEPKGGRSIATVNRYLAVLKASFSLAVRNRKAVKNPVKEIKFQKENNARVRYLTNEEEARLFQILPARYHPLVLVALHTGLRRMELFRLRWLDINFPQRFLRVREAKSGEGRNVPLNDIAAAALQRVPRRIDNPHVFVGEKPGEHRTDVPKSWEGFLFQAGISDFTWHDLRHTFASRLVMAGVDLYTVSKLLGRGDLKITQRSSKPLARQMGE